MVVQVLQQTPNTNYSVQTTEAKANNIAVPGLIQFDTEKCEAERTAKSKTLTRSTYTIT